MREEDIRPADLFSEYRRLSIRDAETLFDQASFVDVCCPACGADDAAPAFAKSGFSYVTCRACASLYVTPRPSEVDLAKFYGNSESTRFWAKVFMPAVIETRRQSIVVPRVQQIAKRAAELGLCVDTLLDVGAGHGMFLVEWRERHPDSRVSAVEAGAFLSQTLRDKKIDVLEAVLEDALRAGGEPPFKGAMVTCFEVIEHVFDPFVFAEALYWLTEPGGTALVTGLGCSGFDIQVLGPYSNSISPPHHINFLSKVGFKSLFKRAGFSNVIIETPGRLDVDIVSKALQDPETGAEVRRRLGHFEQTLLDGGEDTKARFQEFLAANQLSSHTWIWARRST